MGIIFMCSLLCSCKLRTWALGFSAEAVCNHRETAAAAIPATTASDGRRARGACDERAHGPASSQVTRTFELLVCARMMHAVPVHETWGSRAKFPRACTMNLAGLYRALPAIAAESRSLVKHLNSREIGRASCRERV